MNAQVAYSINENNFVLSPEKTIFWEKQNTLILADLHIGKQGHRRNKKKAASPVNDKETLHRLFSQILYTKAEQLIIVGDISHSKSEKETEIFKRWRNDFSGLTIRLVNDNPGLLNDSWYDEMNITRSEYLLISNFSFCHHPDELNNKPAVLNTYTFSGHVHPCIKVKGKSKLGSPFPCFYFKNNYAVLPSFSQLNGFSKVVPQKGENIFAIVDNGLLQLQ